jgi:predicted GTPase
VNRLRIVLLVLLLCLPILVLAGAGGVALWHSGWYAWLWWLLPVCWGAAYLLLRRLWLGGRGEPPEPDPDPHWTPRDEAAWGLVLAEARKASDVPAAQLTQLATYQETAERLARQLARHYHPTSQDPVESLTLVEILTAVELAVRDLSEVVRTGVPGSHLLTVGKLKMLAEAPKWYTWASNALWAASAVVNPAGTAAKYVASRFGIAPLFQQFQGNVLAWFYAAYVQRLGKHLIELNSGRLKVGTDRWLELQSELTDPAGDKAGSTDPTTLTLALVGQLKAGKSSLINALVGEAKADVDVLPATTTVRRYQFAPADLPVRFTLLDTAGYGGGEAGPNAAEEALAAVGQAHVVLLVLDVQMAARQADTAFLKRLRDWSAAHPDRKPPRVLGVVTHIDLLSPSLEWAPPYTGWLTDAPNRAKDRSIREAILHIKDAFSPHLAGVVPVCTAAGKEYGVREWLLPAVAELLPQAQAKRVADAFTAEGARDRWRQLWSQVQASAVQLAKAGFTGAAD